MTRPSFQPTKEQRELVQECAGIGLPIRMIARLIKCDKDTLRKHFADELALGEANATKDIANTLYGKAKAGDTASLIFWLKARANWSERAARNVGPNEDDPEFEGAESLSTEELERRVIAAEAELRTRAVGKKKGSGEPDSVH